MSLGACSGIDVVLILNKQKQAFTDFKIDMNSKREDIKDEAAIFTDIHMEYQLTGEVEHDKAKRAVELSVTKYCSAYKIIASSAQITYSIKVNGAEVK
jgi:putative redox protein